MKIVPMSIELLDSMGTDLSVVNAAKVSFHKESTWREDDFNSTLRDRDIKLINYLAKHGHWTPFAHCFLSFRVKAPIFLAKQLDKTRVGLVCNEVSRRYVDEEPEFWFPKEWRERSENKKQGSSNTVIQQITLSDPVCGEPWVSDTENVAYLHTESCLNIYNVLIRNNVCPEQARMVLPQNTMTEWIWSGSLAAFCRVCRLRLGEDAQKDLEELVGALKGFLEAYFPVSTKALLET